MHGLNVVKVGMAMTALGHKRIRLHGKFGYRVVEFTSTDIENRQRMLADMVTNIEGENTPNQNVSTENEQQELPF